MTCLPLDPDSGVFRAAVSLLREQLGEAGTMGGIALELLQLRAPATLAAAGREGVVEVLLGGAAALVADALAAHGAEQLPTPDDVVEIGVGELTDRPGVWVVLDNCSLLYREHASFFAARTYAQEAAAELRADGFEVVFERGAAGGRA